MTVGLVAITGASGVIGRHVARTLVSSGIPVRLIVRQETSLLPAGLDRAICRDLRTDNLDRHLDGARTIVHLAGIAAASGLPDHVMRGSHVDTTRAVASASRRTGAKLMINMSSILAVCGQDNAEVVDDHTPAAPVSAYGRAKLEAEQALAAESGASFCGLSLRLPQVAAPDANGAWGLLMKLAASGLPLPFSGSDAKRSFCSVETLGEAIAHLARTCENRLPSGSYALADGPPQTLPQTVSLLREGMGMSARLLPGAAVLRAVSKVPGAGQRLAPLLGHLEVDASRFFNTYGFAPDRSLADRTRQCGRQYAQLRGGSRREQKAV